MPRVVPKRLYDGGKIEGDQFLAARWDLMEPKHYMWASVQTIRGCPKHCSFCSVWRTDGQKPRQRNFERVVDEIIDLRQRGFRFIALADDNFYPVTLTDLRLAREQGNAERVESLLATRAERFSLMAELAKLPRDMVFFTQITMESAEDPEFLDAMRKANIKGALVGVEAVTPEGLKAVYKDFNYSGDRLIEQLKTFRKHGLHVLGSFIFGLPTDKPSTFNATVELALTADVTFAQFVMMTPFPGTVDFARWEKEQAADPEALHVDGTPVTRYWLIPSAGSAEDVYAAPVDEFRGDQRADAAGVGPVLRLAKYLEAVCLHSQLAGAAGVCAALEALPADVCRDGHFDGFGAAEEGQVQRPLPGAADAEDLCGEADAGIDVAGVAATPGAGGAADAAGDDDSGCG